MLEPYSAVSKEKPAFAALGRLSEDAPPPALPMEEEIATRFGNVVVKRDNPIIFAKGLLGFPDRLRYCLLEFPVQKFSQFRLLQSTEENELSFITLPIDLNNAIIERADIEAACKELGFPLNDTALLLIVSVHRELKQIRLSANARAPLFIHAPARQAAQYVLHNNKYEVRHMLTA